VTVRSTWRSRIVGAVLSPRTIALRRRAAELSRRARRAPRTVSAFFELDDPYSYLLSSYLGELAAHYAIDLRVWLTEAMRGPYRPAEELYREYALEDCRRVARELGVPFLDKGATPPVEHRRALIDTLLGREEANGYAAEVHGALAAYWRGDAEAAGRRIRDAALLPAAQDRLDRNQALLRRLGHYDTATLHYGGEWYRGIDRLHYLVDRLDAEGVAREPGLAPRIASVREVMRTDLPVSPPTAGRKLPPVDMFYSLRSPYSWLALGRVAAIADAFGVALRFKPVLPMAMRGLPVPRAKRRYIAFDAAREARRHGLPFGRIADPLGVGVERCMAVWQYAVREKREREFLQSAGRAIWARGINVATDEGLRAVTARAGLFWPEAKAALADESWRGLAQANRDEMQDGGNWGVPTLRVGDWSTWGQDRDWMLARHLEELCDSGDGIMI